MFLKNTTCCRRKYSCLSRENVPVSQPGSAVSGISSLLKQTNNLEILISSVVPDQLSEQIYSRAMVPKTPIRAWNISSICKTNKGNLGINAGYATQCLFKNLRILK